MTLGSWIQTFAFGYFTVQLAVRAGSPESGSLYLGLVALAQVVPAITVGPFGGVLADRVDRRRLLILTQSATLVVTALVTALMLTDRVGLAELIAASAVFATISAFSLPARQSLVPNLVPRERVVSAVGLNSAAHFSTQF